ncbi:hypothetical protein BGS_0780 [Beggiatoa sp. SS]|nr:hypothetical protein BGS_0780 [Beggiatoa sp. SS]
MFSAKLISVNQAINQHHQSSIYSLLIAFEIRKSVFKKWFSVTDKSGNKPDFSQNSPLGSSMRYFSQSPHLIN